MFASIFMDSPASPAIWTADVSPAMMTWPSSVVGNPPLLPPLNLTRFLLPSPPFNQPPPAFSSSSVFPTWQPLYPIPALFHAPKLPLFTSNAFVVNSTLPVAPATPAVTVTSSSESSESSESSHEAAIKLWTTMQQTYPANVMQELSSLICSGLPTTTVQTVLETRMKQSNDIASTTSRFASTGCLQKKHACTECKARFPTFSKLKRHSVVHTGERPFPCHMCSNSYSQKHSLEHHTARRHAGRNTDGHSSAPPLMEIVNGEWRMMASGRSHCSSK